LAHVLLVVSGILLHVLLVSTTLATLSTLLPLLALAHVLLVVTGILLHVLLVVATLTGLTASAALLKLCSVPWRIHILLETFPNVRPCKCGHVSAFTLVSRTHVLGVIACILLSVLALEIPASFSTPSVSVLERLASFFTIGGIDRTRD